MKRPIFILLLVFACSLLLAQTWQRTYPWADVCQEEYNNASADVYNVIPAIGGGYLMQGYAEFINYDFPVMMTNIFWKIDENGDVVWRRIGGSWHFNSIVSNGIDRYYALDTDNANLFIFDENMNFINNLQLGPLYHMPGIFKDMVIVDDGLVFAGSLSPGNGWILMKIDFNYDLLWTKEIVNDIPDMGCESLKQSNDGGFIGVSTRMFAQFDAQGDTLYMYNNHGDQYFYDCVQTSDNNIFALGISEDSFTYKIFRVDSIQDTISDITNGLPVIVNEAHLFINLSLDSSLVFLAQTSEGKLHKYNQQGGHEWSRDYQTDNSGYLGYGTKNLICPDSGTIIFCMGDINSHIYMIKVDSLGNVVANEDHILPSSTTNLSNYPNPVQTDVNIKYDVPNQSGMLSLEIFNIRGQKVLTQILKTKSGQYRWNGCDQESKVLKSGVYIYCLKVDGKIVKSNKMIILR
jgi:hypothetical protein